ncbi:hypothetical protein KIH39_04310 [Telmatocola sphagniphila]|uniref:Uncharacterized protein n=1 Tax=Telmatocola sphagniphila TaxID=1123043 RepID=A0A8E6B764_9BACT|nr:hypothetical protein [Telmatocola sphagniphila]QVL33147.1 hypothetical protein KIH39_04310 [Telmatocola sphagniphila]
MKSLTQIVLPIVILAGLVFGITFLTNYTSTESEVESDKKNSQKLAKAPPLKFFTLRADAKADAPYTKFWQSTVEIGSHGNFDFWCQNRHPEPIVATVPTVSCTQCVVAELGVVDPKAWLDFQMNQSMTGFMGIGGLVWNLIGTEALRAGITWSPLNKEGKITTATIPPMKDGVYQQAIVRISWLGKGDPKSQLVTADLNAQLPNMTAIPTRLEASVDVVPSFAIMVVGSPENDIRLGEMTEGTTISRDLIVFSATRPDVDVTIKVSGNHQTENFVWTPLERLPASENETLGQSFTKLIGKPLHIKCAYKTKFTVYESKEVMKDGKLVKSQLDLGPLERRLTFNQGTEALSLPIHGLVRGDITIIGGPKDIDKIDMGTSFPSNQARLREVTVMSNLPNLELELLTDLTVPPFLDVNLTPLPPKDGKPQWSLKVLIPANKLYGALPGNSSIILQSKDASRRRIRIPITGQTFDSGSSKF